MAHDDTMLEHFAWEISLRWKMASKLLEKNQLLMKKNTQILKTRPKLSLGDLILAVSSCTKNTKETVAAVADLLGSGQVRVQSNGRFNRARVC
jgi:hypothetical protein